MTDQHIRDEVAERAAELELTTIDSLKREVQDRDYRLNEAFVMIDDKDKEIERQRLTMGELEIRIEDLKKKPSEQLAKLQAEYDLKCQEVHELKAIEGKRVKEHDFNPASKVASPKQVWVAAGDAFGLYRGLHEATMRTCNTNNPKDYYKKVVFDVTDDSQLKNPRIEGE